MGDLPPPRRRWRGGARSGEPARGRPDHPRQCIQQSPRVNRGSPISGGPDPSDPAQWSPVTQGPFTCQDQLNGGQQVSPTVIHGPGSAGPGPDPGSLSSTGSLRLLGPHTPPAQQNKPQSVPGRQGQQENPGATSSGAAHLMSSGLSAVLPQWPRAPFDMSPDTNEQQPPPGPGGHYPSPPLPAQGHPWQWDRHRGPPEPNALLPQATYRHTVTFNLWRGLRQSLPSPDADPQPDGIPQGQSRSARRGTGPVFCCAAASSHGRRSGGFADRNGHPPSWMPVSQDPRGLSHPRLTGAPRGSRDRPGRDQAQSSAARWRLPHRRRSGRCVDLSGRPPSWAPTFQAHEV
ncbi:hypothetical protein NDU88_010799 [Pleurodeles waltl]|uniref:Uncharacterized protein n=1 Tax=Pleurodeles waltl TaxID=8319 RepID=A0AAV7S4F7_PLEWA|nr:hypothetical protein NDU88_010799 [Pleurodeles waltl]